MSSSSARGSSVSPPQWLCSGRARTYASQSSRRKPRRRSPERPQLRRAPRGHLLRARVAQGRQLLAKAARHDEAFCADEGIPIELCGKVVVAESTGRAPRSRAIERGSRERHGPYEIAGTERLRGRASGRGRPGPPRPRKRHRRFSRCAAPRARIEARGGKISPARASSASPDRRGRLAAAPSRECRHLSSDETAVSAQASNPIALPRDG